MRTPVRVGVFAVALSAVALTAPAAHAAPGDDGTVKIHDVSTGEEQRRNEPHVCDFYLDAFGFDAGQQVDWRIEVWAPTAGTKGETVLSDSLVLDASGHGRTEDLSLPDGHYKLFWNFDGEKGSAKHKVFWSDCEGGKESEEPGGTPSALASASASAPAASEPAASVSASSSAVPVAESSAQGGSGDLAETGSGAPVGLLAGAAAALLAVGGFLMFRRRRSAA
ncbi:hypothetical protein GCM10010451_33830 [Streptomyces virens]|uniref:Gram-positive cocci surface proteins LPxTG domain-containing protein n=1 Tax=Streptomyces virens TaxID=285572 RepID=A0ABP6PKR6_9ACTN|nr:MULTISPECIES: LPXTG cell wall anchor domain-containing protein [Streptomyces]MBA8977896.1 LPXTG-motif cell wall-anchored protein [Streptomyces calvus]MYS25368.1 LPXTG cell wall anchor domain-containing protein [Streptomyces sp. SID7804]